MKAKLASYQPLVFFWLGLLTGALLVAMTFLYGVWKNQDAQTSLLRPSSYSLVRPPSALKQTNVKMDDPGAYLKLDDPGAW